MRILMVAPYPPWRDGIANYSVQMVLALEEEGHEVEVLSPNPSAAQHHLDLHSGARGMMALAKRARHYDRLIIQWHPAFFYASHLERHRIEVDLAFLATCKLAGEVEVWVHEFEYDDAIGSSPRARVARQLWRTVDRLYFHSDVERARFLEATGASPARALLGEHGAAFRKRTNATKEQARRSLGLAPDEFVFLAIGFIQRHKGFDRAVRAFGGLQQHGASLHIVGSTRIDDPSFVAYVHELQTVVDATPGARLTKGYVSDELFDRWIVAADVLVLPYREIWSSGVIERAVLYDRPVIATKVGGLVSQAMDRNVTLVDDDEDLRDAMRKALGVAQDLGGDSWPGEGPDLWEQVQAEVVARAEHTRGYPYVAGTGHQLGDSEAGARVEPVVPLLQVGHYHRARPRGLRARFTDALVARDMAGVADYVNRLRDATLTALRLVDERDRDR